MTFKADQIHLRVECDSCKIVDSYFANSFKKARRYAKQDGWRLIAFVQGAMSGQCTCPRCFKPIRQVPSDPADTAANLAAEGT